MRIVLRRAWGVRGGGFHIWLVDENNCFVKPLELSFSDPRNGACLLPDPTLTLEQRDWDALVQSLDTELLANGIVKQAASLEGELKATKFHLEDMRSLVLEKS